MNRITTSTGRQMTKPATKELFREYLGSAYLAQMSFQSYLAMKGMK